MGLLKRTKNIKPKTAEERRSISNKKIKEQGIACFEQLPMIEDGSQVKLKSEDDICRRAIACLISTQVACDIGGGNDYEESRSLFTDYLKKFGVENSLNQKEKKLFDGSYDMQDALDVSWSYESYWSLVWALGLVKDIEYPYDICDCEKAISMVIRCDSFEDFKSKCKLRDIEEILDMVDLYFRYDWATTENRIRPETPIGKLNPGVVVERRRGLEWLISEESDWNEISLDT